MKPNKNDRDDLRRMAETELMAVPKGVRRDIPIRILEMLLFEIKTFKNKRIPPIKIPVWSGDFLSRINFEGNESEKEQFTKLFDNVSWYVNASTSFSDIFLNENIEELQRKLGDEYAEFEQWVRECSHQPGQYNVYRNTNAHISLGRTWEHNMTGKIYVANCDFFGTDLSEVFDCPMTIENSDMRKTGIKLHPGKASVIGTNLEGVNLSEFVVDFEDMIDNYVFTDCNLRNTGIRIENLSKQLILDQDYPDGADQFSQEMIRRFKAGEFEGCYINGVLMVPQKTRKETAQEKKRQYEALMHDLRQEILAAISGKKPRKK